jgi:hypothetical protein
MTLVKGKQYKFKCSDVPITFIGKDGHWSQFEKEGHEGVWCELLDKDFNLIEEYNESI